MGHTVNKLGNFWIYTKKGCKTFINWLIESFTIEDSSFL